MHNCVLEWLDTPSACSSWTLKHPTLPSNQKRAAMSSSWHRIYESPNQWRMPFKMFLLANPVQLISLQVHRHSFVWFFDNVYITCHRCCCIHLIFECLARHWHPDSLFEQYSEESHCQSLFYHQQEQAGVSPRVWWIWIRNRCISSIFRFWAPCFCIENLPFMYALICVTLGFIPSQVPSKAANSAGTGDGLDSCLVLPIDFCWELVSEACRTLNDYRKLPNIERWNSLEAIVLQKSDGTLLP